jgi:hypothetical protein
MKAIAPKKPAVLIISSCISVYKKTANIIERDPETWMIILLYLVVFI